MKTAGVNNGILFVGFNQDSSRIAVGTKTGSTLYTCDPFETHTERAGEDASIIAMHYKTDLVASVGAGEAASSSQRCLRLLNVRKDKEILRRNYQSAILNVQMNSKRVVVVLESTIYIYELSSMDHMHTIEEIPSNPSGLCALPAFNDRAEGCHFLAYPNNSTTGCVLLYDLANFRAGPVIEAHTSRVSCLAFNNNGTILATASEKGTVFRLFSLPSGNRLYEFRRSVATNATIFSMSFDRASMLLSVSSDHPTIHIFKLESPEAAPESEGWGSYLSRSVASAAAYLPSSVSDFLSQTRSFAQVSLRQSGNPNVCTLVGTWPDVHVLVATSEGILYKYAIDTTNGGECEYKVAYPLCDNAEIPPEDAETTEAGPDASPTESASAAVNPSS